VVDEPTAGLDPLLRTKIWDHLRRLRDFGVTIIVTTQNVGEAEYCDAVGILHRGQLIAEGSPEELRKHAVGGEALDVQAAKFERGDIAALWQLPCVRSARWVSDDELRCTVDDIGEATVAITEALHDRGTEVTAVRPHSPSFDEAFLALVGDGK
jgi:ABC-2 type transport system ATP-binding protein